jgi:hypothetical protein
VRLSDADRERLFAQLSRHAAAGSIDVTELERRVEIVAGAETVEQAAAAVSDLPPLPSDRSPVRVRGRRGHGHGHAAAPAPEWRPTAERFRDPRTGRVMRVWEDAAGTRHYVLDD